MQTSGSAGTDPETADQGPAVSKVIVGHTDGSVEEMELDELDPLGVREDQKHMSNVWRSWSEHASPELRQEFESRTRDCIQGVRVQYPGNIQPGSGEYRNLRRACVEALNRLSEAVQAEHDESQH